MCGGQIPPLASLGRDDKRALRSVGMTPGFGGAQEGNEKIEIAALRSQ
ncbi:MAG TPA: hypothetical protein VMW16_17110 [Sedimentisphaerales bacterium]|nr:hypothetical protein [Sedimentisphaerales bacterium]